MKDGAVTIAPQAGGQTIFLAKPEFEVLYGGAAGPGKATSLDTLILTPDGYVTMENIEIGDKVYTDKGEITTVVAKSKIEYDAECYAVEFDNGEIVKCDARHLWATMTGKDRSDALRLTDEFRRKRRANRKSRAKRDAKNKGAQKNITAMNKAKIYKYKSPPSPTLKTTEEISKSVLMHKRGVNHSIRLTRVEGCHKNLPIDPYLLGLWLGDGVSRDGTIGMENTDFINCIRTISDVIVARSIVKKGYNCVFTMNRIEGLREKLKNTGLIRNKHIPNIYFNASVQQRIALLQGIMDTDGYVGVRGDMELTFSEKHSRLFNDFIRLIVGLGIKKNGIKGKTIKIDDKTYRATRVSFTADFLCFRLKRKAERQKFSDKNKASDKYYIKSVRKIPTEPAQCITVSDERGMYLITKSNIATHNSWSLVIDALGLQYEKTALGKKAIDCPKYRAVLFRRRSTQLAELIDEAKEYYQHFGAEYVSKRVGDPGPSFNFPSGAKIYFCHLNEEKDKESHHGFEYQFVGFDELTQFTFTQYIYLFSRCRSTIGGLFPRIRSTTNPVGEGLRWVRQRFEPHLRENVTQYFISDPENEDNYRGLEVSPTHKYAIPRCYVPGRLAENKILMEKDPGYASRIKAMGRRTSAALLDSDWEAMEGQFFDMFSSRIHVIRPENYLSWTDIRMAYTLEGGLDYGNDTVLEVAGKDANGNVIFFDELYFSKETRSEKIAKTKEFLRKRGLPKLLIVGDTNMWIKDAFDKADQLSPAMEYLRAGIRLIKVSKASTSLRNVAYRKNTNDAFKDALHWEENDSGEITKQPKIKIYARCKELIASISDLVSDENDPEDFADGQFDHPYDGGKYVFMHLSKKREDTTPGEPAWLRKLRQNKVDKPKSFMEV